MIKFIEFLGRLVVRGYLRSAKLEGAISTKAAKGYTEAQELADRLFVTSIEASRRAADLEGKAAKLEVFFK